MNGKLIAHHLYRAFTLVELLVVISVIVVLLALLVPALSKALTASEKAKCGSNQRNVAQVIVSYSLNSRYKLIPSVATWTQQSDNRAVNANDPTIVVAGDFAYAMDYRATSQAGVASSEPSVEGLLAGRTFPGIVTATAGAPPTPGQVAPRRVLGLGILPALGLLPQTKLGEIGHCPSLNTASSAPTARFGMDETYAIASNNQQNVANADTKGAGCSYYVDPAQADARIIGSYNYRGLSFALKRGGTAVIQYSQIGPSFLLLMDNPDLRYGRQFSHKEGYNVAYGDGSCRWYQDTPKQNDGEYRPFGNVERGVAGQWSGIPGYNTNPPLGDNNNPTSIDGRSGYNPNNNDSLDERLFEFVQKSSGK